MREEATSWVVYLTPVFRKDPAKGVCEQSDWDAMESRRPGYHTLIQAGIATEGEAENLARAGTEVRPVSRLKPRS